MRHPPQCEHGKDETGMFKAPNDRNVEEQSRTILTDEIKQFIVRGLARYETPSQVAETVQATFGVTVSRQQVYRYDPACSQPPAQRWRDLHAVARGKFLAEIAEIGVAHRAVRLRRLDDYVNRADENDDVRLVVKLLEQAAKECGGVYENRKNPLSRAVLPQDG
ncbi:DUF2280 domain-containing protein [Dongia sedimenti]|uniref:DUF2280 domain-containing protein n=1 Tax=Dongia sedimenti TaxID=3064282 RepID=A0ABU0YJ66_9PROT|nr:DUF2280 domain-containing protein [Rhodospirillaceae bacterium R-7]